MKMRCPIDHVEKFHDYYLKASSLGGSAIPVVGNVSCGSILGLTFRDFGFDKLIPVDRQNAHALLSRLKAMVAFGQLIVKVIFTQFSGQGFELYFSGDRLMGIAVSKLAVEHSPVLQMGQSVALLGNLYATRYDNSVIVGPKYDDLALVTYEPPPIVEKTEKVKLKVEGNKQHYAPLLKKFEECGYEVVTDGDYNLVIGISSPAHANQVSVYLDIYHTLGSQKDISSQLTAYVNETASDDSDIHESEKSLEKHIIVTHYDVTDDYDAAEF